LLPKAVVATASYAGLREGELRGLEWPDYTGDALARQSVNMEERGEPTEDARQRSACSSDSAIGDILNAFCISMGNPKNGVMFHVGDGKPIDCDKLAQRLIRPVVEAIGKDWYGRHGFRRGTASNLYELGANEKIVQRVLHHAKPHVTKDRYIKSLIRLFSPR
jgi:integrase